MKTRLSLALCLLTAFLLTSCDQIKPPVFKEVQNLRIVGLNAQELKLSGDALFNNPNGIGGLALAGMDVAVEIAGTPIGDIRQDDLGVDLQPNKDFSVPFQIAFPISKIATQNSLQGLLGALVDQKVNVKLDGSVTVGLAKKTEQAVQDVAKVEVSKIRKTTKFSIDEDVPIKR